MSIFLIKSLLSMPLLLLTLFSTFTMFEIFGRSERKYSIGKLKRLHAVSGYLYIILFIFISYLCIDFIVRTRTELSPRGSMHALISTAVAALLFLKIVITRTYRQLYPYAKTMGITMAVLSLLMIGSSAGYYLFAYGAVENRQTMSGHEQSLHMTETGRVSKVRTDEKSIMRGKKLFDIKCSICHDPMSKRVKVGPGLKGVLKNDLLPVSKKVATPENIAEQLHTPFRRMPSFSYLSNEDVEDIVSYLNTL
jgi:mono/diheme cytochrome c family protein